jgi:hypothetical protein
MATSVVLPLTGRLDMALSNYAKGYRNNEDVTDYLFPRVPVLRQTDRYWVFGREAQQLANNTLRAPGSPAERTSFKLSTDSYFAQSHALAATVADEEKASYTIGDLNQTTVELLQQKLMLDRQSRAAAKVTTPGNYPAANTLTLAGGSQWSDYVNSDPIVAVEVAKAAIITTGSPANVLILSYPVFQQVRNHPKVIERFKYTNPSGFVSAQQLATVFGVDRVIVAAGIKDNGDGTQNFLWGKNAILAYVAPTVLNAGVIGAEGQTAPKDISFGKSFVWTNAPLTIDGYGVVIARHSDATAKADLLGVDWYSDEKITAPESGYLFASAVA